MRKFWIAALFAASLAGAASAGEREVSIDGGKAPLYGTLATPVSASPGPAILMIAGSGPTDRNGDSTVPGVKPGTFRMLADGLQAEGVTSLRFDKRMIGKSAAATTSEADLRFDTFINDAVAWTRLLAAQPGVTCVVIFGHSEGALIATLAAQRTPVCGLVLAAGAGHPLGEVIETQLKTQMPPATMAQVMAVMAELRAGRTVPGIPATDPLFRPSVQPYLISQISIDPAAELKKTRFPVLILQGETDLQVSLEDARLLAAARRDARLEILPGVNHVLKPAPADRAANIATYADPALPLDSRIVPLVAGFVKATKP
jgi:hypothetical protein